jgi:hypothetical protein
MDTIGYYGKIVEELLNKYASIRKTLTPGVRSELIIDRERHHYQLLTIGWHQHLFIYTIVFHFDIIDGKLWIQQNNTDALIADELVQRGVDRNDIVMGFISEQARNRVESSGQRPTSTV